MLSKQILITIVISLAVCAGLFLVFKSIPKQVINSLSTKDKTMIKGGLVVGGDLQEHYQPQTATQSGDSYRHHLYPSGEYWWGNWSGWLDPKWPFAPFWPSYWYTNWKAGDSWCYNDKECKASSLEDLMACYPDLPWSDRKSGMNSIWKDVKPGKC